MAVQLGTWALGPVVPLPALVGYVLTFAMVAAAVLGAGAQAPAGPPRILWSVALPVALVTLVVALGIGGPLAAALLLVGLLGGGTLLGGVIGGRVQRAGHLLVVAWVSAIADLYSVLGTHGVTARVVEDERMLSALALSWPIVGSREIVPVLGLGDVVMTALYLVASRKLGLGVKRTAAALGGAYALVLALLLVLERPLPALPLLGMAVVLAHPASRRFHPSDRRSAFIGMGIATALFAGLWLLS